MNLAGKTSETAVSTGTAAVPFRSRGVVVKPSRALLRFFDVYFGFFLRRHFHGLRIAGSERWIPSEIADATSIPRIVCLNHASWWDPLVCILISRFLERSADHFAPMDAVATERYSVFRKVGLFPVEQGSARGAVQFLRSARAILTQPESVLWITPQGGFTDVRQRPVVFRGGLGALLNRLPQAVVLPLAIEYTFWDERLPEALALIGDPIHFVHGVCHASTAPAGEQVAEQLARTQDALAALSIQRNPGLFRSISRGHAGTSGIYGGWQRLQARLRGRHFVAEHGRIHGDA